MSGFIWKDCYSLKKTFGLYSVLVLAFAVICLITGRSVFLPLPAVLIFSTMITGSFTKDRIVNWNQLAVTTGAGRKGLVRGKYGLFCLILFVGSGISALLGMIGVLIGSAKLISEIELFLMGLAIAIFAGSISLALLYTWRGAVEKVELLTVISYAAAAGIVIGILRGTALMAEARIVRFLLCLGSAVFFFFLSYVISVKAFEKSDLD